MTETESRQASAATTPASPKKTGSALSSMADGWAARLSGEFEKPYMESLRAYLKKRKQQKNVIYPHSRDWFTAFNITAFNDVKVVILGQDPYHGPGQAHGLSFSVPKGVSIPPSLLNMYKELKADLDLPVPMHGNLTAWSEQGVFLLNSVLTVEHAKAGSHQGRGWEKFTDKAIDLLSDDGEGRVFMLWGAYAQKKGQIIDTARHLVLKAPHPSPLSAHRGFMGCQHFSKTNEYRVGRGEEPINWLVED